MKVIGFTFIKNAIIYDYPVVEAIQSILPLCDHVVVAVGKSEDETLELVESIHPEKVRIVKTVWDEQLRQGGKVLALETDKAYRAIDDDADWCFYIQGDEALHEQYYDEILDKMQKYAANRRVEGLLFNYRHFYGSYDYVGDSRKWYRREVRIIRKDNQIHAFRDAQGFRKNGRKLWVKPLDAFIHHYGWVKHPEQQQLKMQNFHRYWHDDQWMDKNIPQSIEFDYSNIDSLKKYEGTHPKVMIPRIEKMNWTISFNPERSHEKWNEKLIFFVEKILGYRIGEYRNFKILKDG